jgi:hypothetical protein
VVPHVWQNDFSAARNAGLEAAEGEWVFWIDADERLIAPDTAGFRSLLDCQDVLGYYVTIEDVVDGQLSMTPRRHRSLYRRRPEVRYTGRIHEHFDPPLETLALRLGMTMKQSGVALRHTGYHPSQRSQKLRRNIALLELELRDRPSQLYYLIELGRSLLLSGDPHGHRFLDQAALAVLQARGEAQAPIPLVAALLEYVLIHARREFALSGSVAVELGEKWFPQHPAVVWSAARWHYRNGDIASAARMLGRLLEMGQTAAYDDSVSFDRQVFGDETRLNFGVCLAKLSRFRDAVEQFKRISASSPFFAAAEANLKRLSRAK